jgi:hypothetical protein
MRPHAGRPARPAQIQQAESIRRAACDVSHVQLLKSCLLSLLLLLLLVRMQEEFRAVIGRCMEEFSRASFKLLEALSLGLGLPADTLRPFFQARCSAASSALHLELPISWPPSLAGIFWGPYALAASAHPRGRVCQRC